MRRVARRVVVLTFEGSDVAWLDKSWLIRDGLPEVADLFLGLPSLSELAGAIDARTEPVPVAWDCADGFFEAFWRRPEAYLDDQVRSGMSVWNKVGRDAERRAVRDLAHDLEGGRWAERNHELLRLEAADLGLRLLIA